MFLKFREGRFCGRMFNRERDLVRKRFGVGEVRVKEGISGWGILCKGVEVDICIIFYRIVDVSGRLR